MSFEITQKTTLSVTIYGEKITFTAPSAYQLKSVQEQVERAATDGRSALDVWFDWLCALGFPRPVIEQLEVEHLRELIDYITGSKKN